MKAKSSGSTGGGGGGGAPPPAAPSLQTTGLNSAAPVTMNTDGTTKAAAQYKTGDSKLTLDIASGTKMINSQGKTLTTLSAAVLANPPAAPEGNAVLLAYELGPEGAAFTPALTITFSYGTLPEGAKNISLMYWNGTAWESVQANVDTVKGTITASISHFSKYAMVYQLPTPANITFAGITISPQTVKPDEKVTIQASVANSGDLSGSYKLVLKVNDRQVDSKEVTIAGGKTETVSFEVQRGIEAEYTVDVNGQKGKFTVGSPAPATPPTSSTPNTPSTPETTPSVAPFTTEPAFTAQASPTLSSTVPVITTSAIPSPTPEDNKSTPFNWALLVGIIGAVAVLVVIMVVVARRPKKKA
jgi:hypothetical protein